MNWYDVRIDVNLPPRYTILAPREMVLGDVIDWADSRPETWEGHKRRYLAPRPVGRLGIF